MNIQRDNGTYGSNGKSLKASVCSVISVCSVVSLSIVLGLTGVVWAQQNAGGNNSANSPEGQAPRSLAAALSEAKSDAEREALLANDPEGVTGELLRLLGTQSDGAFTQGNHERALNLLQSQRLVAERLGNQEETANSWQNIGIIHFVKKRYSHALEAYQKSLAINEKLEKRPETARLLFIIAQVYSVMEQPKTAIEYFQRSLNIRLDLNDKNSAAQVLEDIGDIYSDLGDYASASESYRKSIMLFDAASAKAALANCLVKVARTEYGRGDDEAAVELYHQALARKEEAGLKGDLGYILHSIANIYYSQGDYPRALNYYQRSLKSNEDAGNRQGMANALLGIGLVYSLNGDHAAALETYLKNLEIAQSLKDKIDIATAFKMAGGAYFNLGQYAEALDAYRKALALREELGDQQETAGAMLDVGIACAAQGDYPGALDHYRQGREKFEAAGNQAGVAAALLNACVVHYAQSDLSKSLEVAARAADAAKLGEDLDLYWQARYRSGKAYYHLEQYERARESLAEAITVIETRLSSAGGSRQSRFSENRLAPYLAMVDVLISQNRGGDAFNFAERARSRVLLGLLKSTRVWINKTMTPREKAQERRLITDLASFTTQIQRELEGGNPNGSRLDELNTRLRKTRLDYDLFKKGLYARHPPLKVMRGEGEPLTFEKVATLLPDAETAILDYVETDERLYLFAFARNGKISAKRDRRQHPDQSAGSPADLLKIYVLDMDRGDMASRLTRFRQAIASRDPSVQMPARELYDLLVKPAEEQLAGRTHLILSPSGTLWNLPFQALRIDEDRYLIEGYSLSYAPSLTAYNSVLGLGRTRHPRRTGTTGPPTLLAFGDPGLSQDTVDRLKEMLPAEHLNRSQEVQSEIDGVGKLYGEKSRSLFIGEEADEARFKSEAGKYSVLHIAAPGLLNEASPLLSSVALSSKIGTTDDGLLEARELLGLDLNAGTIVISGSEAASVPASAGRALTGLTWSSFIAGCPSMLLSQWRTESPATTELMLGFHADLMPLEGRRRYAFARAEAWQSSVKRLLTGEDYRHPYFWSGFVLLGDGR